MNRYEKPAWRATRIPSRIIKRLYGSGNFDSAEEDIFEALNLVSEYANQYRCRIDIDSTHPNPWYHAMVFEIEGISDSAYEKFVKKLVDLRLLETPGSV